MSEAALPAEAPVADATPGERLRVARERHGLGVGAVAEALHVAPRLIDAMEANRFEAFDAPVYARGFLRKYAAFLELPVEEVLAGYEALAGSAAPPSLIPVMNVAPAKPPLPPISLPRLAAGVALVAVAAGLWWWGSRPHVPVAGSGTEVATVAEREPAAATVVSLPAPLPAADAASVRPPEAADAAPTSSAALPAAAATLPAATTASPAALPPPARSARVAGGGPRDALVIRGLADTWVEVYGPSGTRLVFDIVRGNEVRTASGPGPWRVFLGRQDGVRLSVDERAVPVPAVRRGATTARFVVARDGAVQ
ncbi:MAG: DUF4115 domain-containing protein [Proteobacteria bacterium]|nr:DUF4115 domain-containing protein [Pseudomonadota bacterium]